MSLRRAVRSPAVLLPLGFALVSTFWFWRGPEVGRWAAIGLIGTAGYLWGTWLGLRMAGRTAGDVRTGGAVLLLVFLLKVPPIVLLALAARDASGPLREGLLLGAAVVYSWIVAWGLLPQEPPGDRAHDSSD